MKNTRVVLCLLSVLSLATACDRNMSSNTYTSGAAAGKVVKGTVVSVRPVTIKAKDRLEENTVGGLAGGVAGGVGGSAIGKGKGSTAAAVGGAVAGAIIGAMVQDALGTSDGFEYIVELDGNAKAASKTKKKKEIKLSSKNAVQDDISTSIELDAQTNMVSVIQQDEIALAQGTQVYVIYNDDRPRVVAR